MVFTKQGKKPTDGHRPVTRDPYEYSDRKRVTITAESPAAGALQAGDELRLIRQFGTCILINEEGDIIPSEICMNVSRKRADHLARAGALFSVRQVNGTVFRAVLKNPYALVHHGRRKWVYTGW